jgi:hypothetical protein
MAYERNPNDPYSSPDDPYRPNLTDDLGRPTRLENELQLDPELADANGLCRPLLGVVPVGSNDNGLRRNPDEIASH